MPLLPAYAALLALGVIWGSNFIFMKWATALVSPAQTEFLRVLFGFLPLAFMAWRAGVIHRAQLRHLPHFAVGGAFSFMCLCELTRESSS